MPSSSKKVLIAADHAGVALKTAIQKQLPEWEWIDLGPLDTSRVDYPDYAAKLAGEFAKGTAKQGILICGSGIGMCITANKFAGVRAAVVENPVAAQLSKQHNDANVLCLGARFIAAEYAADIAKAWLETPFSNDERHAGRLKKIADLEKKNGC